MKVFGSFAVEKLGNVNDYFMFDCDFADDVSKNTWSMDPNGYVCRNKDGKLQRLHVLVIEKHTGVNVPSGLYIDHINKCKTDNRLCNLRIVSPEDSSRNMPINECNTSGVTGVSQTKKGKYRAYITVNKKRIELGQYKTLHEASRVRYAAEERYGFRHQQNLTAFLCEMER